MKALDQRTSVKKADADVIVIGGGAAGNSTAINLARRGRHVILLEGRESGPVQLSDLHSGEVLSPGSQQELGRLGLPMITEPLRSFLENWQLQEWDSLVQRWPDGRVTHDRLPSGWHFGQINRGQFYRTLRRLAQAEGVEVREGQRVINLLTDQAGRCRGVVSRPHKTDPATEPTCLYAPVVVDASGRNSVVVARRGLRRPELQINRAAYIFFFARLNLPALEPGRWLQYWLPGGTTLRGSVLAAGLSRFSFEASLDERRRWLERYGRLSGYELLLRVLGEQGQTDLLRAFQEAERLPHSLAFAPIGYRVSQITHDGLLMVGDAAGYLDPSTGQGLEFALRMGRLAAATLTQAFEHNRFDRRAFDSYLVGRQAEVQPTVRNVRRFLAISRRSWLLNLAGQLTPLRRVGTRLLVAPRPTTGFRLS